MLKDDDLLARIEQDWRNTGLSAMRVTMLEYAEKLTLSPGEVSEFDVSSLQAASFADRDVLDICEVVAYYAHAN